MAYALSRRTAHGFRLTYTVGEKLLHEPGDETGSIGLCQFAQVNVFRSDESVVVLVPIVPGDLDFDVDQPAYPVGAEQVVPMSG